MSSLRQPHCQVAARDYHRPRPFDNKNMPEKRPTKKKALVKHQGLSIMQQMLRYFLFAVFLRAFFTTFFRFVTFFAAFFFFTAIVPLLVWVTVVIVFPQR